VRSLLVVLVLLLVSCRDRPEVSSRDRAGAGSSRTGAEGPYAVQRVVDGDTIRVRTPAGPQKVRFLCIDTPEVSGPREHALGHDATRALRDLLGSSDVTLEPDAGHDDTDRYGRLLRHVFLPDGTHLNVEMVRLGWSAYYTKYGPCDGAVAFDEAETQAEAASRGIWAHPDFLSGGYLRNARGSPPP